MNAAAIKLLMPSNTEAATTLGGNTLVQIGFVVGFLTMFGAAVWWASGVQSDLNSIKSSLVSERSRYSNIDSIEMRLKMVEQYGSPKTIELEKTLRQLERTLEAHRLETSAMMRDRVIATPTPVAP